MLLVLLLSPAAIAQEEPFRVIVHPENPAGSVEKEFLSDVFLRKTTRWPDGEAVRAVDLRADSPVRRKFSQSIVGRPVAAVKSYWQQNIFSGRDVPPPEVGGDAEVLKFVREHRGAVGYVSPQADVSGVKVLGIR